MTATVTTAATAPDLMQAARDYARIFSILHNVDEDDLFQEAWLKWNRIEIDPSKSTGKALISVVTKRTAVDIHRRRARQDGPRQQVPAGLELGDLEALTMDPARDDGSAFEVLGEVEAARQLLHRVRFVHAACGYPASDWDHVVALVIGHDEDTGAASAALGVSADILRANRRRFSEIAALVRICDALREHGEPVTLSAALARLDFARAEALRLIWARVEAVGGLACFDAEAEAPGLGMRHSTVRQYRATLGAYARGLEALYAAEARA